MKVLKIKSKVLLFALVFGVFFVVAHPVAGATKMPDFILDDAVTGDSVSSEIFKGKALLVTFFATWCPPCMEEIPSLIMLQEEFATQGFSVIGMSADMGGRKVVRRLIERRSINYPVLMASGSTMENDFGGVPGYPTTFLINKNGNVVKRYVGYRHHQEFARDIEKIMN